MAKATVSNAGSKAKGKATGFAGKSSTGKVLSTEFNVMTTDPKTGNKTAQETIKIVHR